MSLQEFQKRVFSELAEIRHELRDIKSRRIDEAEELLSFEPCNSTIAYEELDRNIIDSNHQPRMVGFIALASSQQSLRHPN